MKPIRPSETSDFLRCPRLWLYKHVEGWQAPPSAWTPERLMGSAVHAGLAAYWTQQGPPASVLSEVLVGGWPAEHEALDRSLSVAQAVLQAVLDWIPQAMSNASPLMVEEPLGEDGHTTPDLVTREPEGIVVTDWKTHWALDPEKVRYRLEGLDRTHQFLHYAWAVGERLNEPVALVRKVVIVGSPRIMVRDTTWAPKPAELEQWLHGARQIWQDMTDMREGQKVAYQRPDGCLMYGPKYPCEMWEACWTCQGDRKKMAQFLVKPQEEHP